MFIINNEQLKQFYQECQKDKYIAIDTEFFWTTTYEPELCLIQLANDSQIYLIDPLQHNINLNYLKKLLIDKKIKKIFHSSSQDLRIFYNLFKIIPVNIFDTQVGVLPLGYENSVSLKRICNNFLNINLDKHLDQIDWRKRPLSRLQIAYAENDVKHLKKLYDEIKSKLRKEKRMSWVNTHHKKLLDKNNYVNKEKNAWKKLKFIPKTRKELFLLKKFSFLREKIAKKENISPKEIISNSRIIKLSKSKDWKKYEFVENVSNKQLKIELKKVNFQNIKHDEKVIHDNQELIHQKVKNLQKIIKNKAETLNIHPSLIASKSEITQIVLQKNVNHFVGWKRKFLSQTIKKIVFR